MNRIYLLDFQPTFRVLKETKIIFNIYIHLCLLVATRAMIDMKVVKQRMDSIDAINDLYSAVHKRFKDLIDEIPVFWERNEETARFLISQFDFKITLPISDSSSDRGWTVGPPRKEQEETIPAASSSAYNSISQLMAHLARDWGPMGAPVRKSLYFEGIIPLLLRHVSMLPKDADSSINKGLSLLLPGAGLGRLAVELAILGFRYARLFSVYVVGVLNFW